METTDKRNTNKRNTDKDCIVDSNSAMSKGKYVPVCKKHKPNMYSPIPVTGSMLGLANVTTWDEIEKKIRAMKSKTYADKAKAKRKVSSCTLHLQAKVLIKTLLKVKQVENKQREKKPRFNKQFL
ncbi:hypothetical protein Tco_1408846 [Tanacetum coccineum]